MDYDANKKDNSKPEKINKERLRDLDEYFTKVIAQSIKMDYQPKKKIDKKFNEYQKFQEFDKKDFDFGKKIIKIKKKELIIPKSIDNEDNTKNNKILKDSLKTEVNVRNYKN